MSPDCVTLWVGEALGPLESACLRSVVRQGHRLALYCYSRPSGVPEGVEVRDASTVLPEAAVRAPWCARADLYSDWFRYELLRRGLGTWLDTDLYLVGPLDLSREYLFGEQGSGILNNAILRLPPDSPLLPELLEPFKRQTTPKWMPRRLYWPSRMRELINGSADLTRIPWGTTSPHALTALCKVHGLEHLAEPPDRFYPVPWQEADWILDPDQSLEDKITERTVAVHLWSERIKAFKNGPAPPGSFLDRLHTEGQV